MKLVGAFLNIFVAKVLKRTLTIIIIIIITYSTNMFFEIKSTRMRLAGHGARMGDRRGIYRVLVGKPEGSIPLGRPRR